MRRVSCNGTAWMALAPSRHIGFKHLEWESGISGESGKYETDEVQSWTLTG